MPELADAYHETADKRAFEILTKARSAGNPITRARAAVRLGTFDLERPSEIAKAQRAALLEEARAVFEAESYDLGLAEYWRAEAQERWAAARAAETAEACEHALFHLERAGAAQSHIGQRTRQLLLRTESCGAIVLHGETRARLEAGRPRVVDRQRHRVRERIA